MDEVQEEIKMEHEKLYRFPSGFRARWCNVCKVLHGYLYECEHFSDEVRAEIRLEDAKKKAAIGLSVAALIVFSCLLLILG